MKRIIALTFILVVFIPCFINAQDTACRALMILDIQHYFTEKVLSENEAGELIKKINSILEKAGKETEIPQKA